MDSMRPRLSGTTGCSKSSRARSTRSRGPTDRRRNGRSGSRLAIAPAIPAPATPSPPAPEVGLGPGYEAGQIVEFNQHAADVDAGSANVVDGMRNTAGARK